ncbi:MAG: hypothetical protein JST30_14840 [Armatimonadetes bacterium]|nr:hypothetical protein [Armatimonadota bacterium]
MSVRGVFAAFAVLGIIEAGVVLPRISQAGQLAESATATSISGSMHSLNNTNIHAPGKARALARQASEARGGSYQPEEPVSSPSKGRRAAQGQAGPAEVALFDEKSAVKGRTYATDGTVVFDGIVEKHRVVVLVRIDGPNKFQLLGFRPLDAQLPAFPEKAQVQVSGTYAGKIREPQSGSMIHGFDKAVFSAVGASPQSTAATTQPKPEEKPTFSSALKGWTFRGTAQVDGQSTGVFVNENRVKYAQAGDELADGVKVKKVFNGSVRIVADHKTLDLMPW